MIVFVLNKWKLGPLFQANSKKSRWYLTFLPNGAAEEEENDTDHEEVSILYGFFVSYYY